jgi:hypothetical protein
VSDEEGVWEEGVPPDGRGATTASEGTPFAVDVRGDRRGRANLAVLVVGPVLWLTHFMVVYLVAEAGCTGDGPGLDVFDPPVPERLTLGATALAVAACLVAAAWGLRRWQAAVRRTPLCGADLAGAPADLPVDGVLGFAGFLLSLLSCAAVVLVAVPALALPTC